MGDGRTIRPRETSLFGRRSFLGAAGAAAIAAGVGTRPRAAQASVTSDTTALAYFDMSSLNNVSVSNTAQVTDAYDQMHLVSSLQGLVNRTDPALFVNLIVGDQFGPINLDQYWLSKLQAQGQWLSGRPLSVIHDLDTLIGQFGSKARGAVVWDPNVWATSNVATTVAGADDLVVIRYDTQPTSLYTKYVASGRLPAQVWLVNPDGSSIFTGKGTIPGTQTPSSGSAKCDAYLWAKIHYLDTGRTNPAEMGYYLDAYWLTKPNVLNEAFPLPTCALMNHDYLVANRAFLLDLSVFSDLAPEDDPGQDPGTDLSTLEAILKSARGRAGQDQMIAMHGFLPWAFKYSSTASSTDWHNPVDGEWQSVQLMSSYNVYLDSDAGPGIESLVNASLYQHYPLDAFYPQNPKPSLADFQAAGYVDSSGAVAPKRYIAFYAGDWDSAAWMYHFVPRVWDDAQRGTIPMSWAFNPNTDQRMAPALAYTRQSKSPKDFFIAGDSGAGYVNPGALEPPRPAAGGPSAVAAWTQHCHTYYHRWDISLSGFNIDGFSDALSEDALAASYGQFSPDGVVAQKSYRVGMAGNMPYVRQAGDVPSEAIDQAAKYVEQNYLSGDTSQPPLRPDFTVVRTVLQGAFYTKGVMDQILKDLPNADIELVDAYTLLGLVRQHLADRVTLDPQRALVSPGAATPVLLGAVNRLPQPATISVTLKAPSGWQVSPTAITATLGKNSESQLRFDVTPPASAAPGATAVITASMTGPGISEDIPFTTVVITKTYAGATSVSVSLGTANQPDGLVQRDESFDGPTTATAIAGKPCRQIKVTNNGFTKANHMYFNVDDTFMFNEQDAAARISVEYFDAPGQHFSLEYDARDGQRPMDGIFASGGAVTTTGTNTWRTRNFTIQDVYFGNRQMPSPDYRVPGVADFRLSSVDPIAIASVTVTAIRR